MTTAHQQAAIKRLEALFKDVSLEQQKTKPRVVRIETKVDRCCEIHGNRYKENCAFRRNAPSPVITSHTITPMNRRGSLNIPMSPPQRDSHPSGFPNSLRKEPLGSSLSAINNHTNKSHPLGSSPNIRRDSLGRSMSSLKKDTSSAYNAPLRRDYVAKSMTNLQKSALGRRDSDGALSPILTSTAKIREKLASAGDLTKKGYTTGTLKGVGFKDEPRVGSLNSLGKDARMSPSYDSRKFSADSLENLHKRHSWDPARRGSSGSSGGWDDPIWEETDYETSVDEVM